MKKNARPKNAVEILHQRYIGNDPEEKAALEAECVSAEVARMIYDLRQESGATAVAEKVSALRTARFLEERKARTDFKAFDKIMKRRGGKPPREGDEMPG